MDIELNASSINFFIMTLLASFQNDCLKIASFVSHQVRILKLIKKEIHLNIKLINFFF